MALISQPSGLKQASIPSTKILIPTKVPLTFSWVYVYEPQAAERQRYASIGTNTVSVKDSHSDIDDGFNMPSSIRGLFDFVIY